VSPAVVLALVRMGRTLAAGAIASAVVLVPQLVGLFTLDPVWTLIGIAFLQGLLNGLGKLLRGDKEVTSAVVKLPI
jgi:hypothetical protein